MVSNRIYYIKAVINCRHETLPAQGLGDETPPKSTTCGVAAAKRSGRRTTDDRRSRRQHSKVWHFAVVEFSPNHAVKALDTGIQGMTAL